MGRLNRYLFKNACINIGGLIVFACVVLLLERLLRIFEVVTKSANPAGDASQMVVNLLPHYLGIAVPMALMLGVLLTVDRFSRSSELTAALGAGVSLPQMTKPFFLIALILAGSTLFIEGYMQPIGRYNYRAIVNSVSTNSEAALQQGTPVVNDKVLLYAGTSAPAAEIGPIYIRENLGRDKGYRITTAQTGRLIAREGTNQTVLQLAEGESFRIAADRSMDGKLDFKESSLAGAVSNTRFRRRGNDERELTTLELFSNTDGQAVPAVSANVNNATLHLRMGRAALLLILPFLAVPFGINYGRNPSSAGIFISVVLLVTLQKILEFGQGLGAAGKVPPWAGIWPIIGTLALVTFIIYRKSAYKMGQPPLTTVNRWFSEQIDSLKSKIRNFGQPPETANPPNSPS